MKQFVVFGCLIALFTVAAGDAVATKHGWLHLGERTVTDRADHDVFFIQNPKRGLRALKFAVRRHAVEFRRIKITFANGKTQEHSLNAVIPAGGESRVLDLVGNERTVTKVEFWYDAHSRGKHAIVKLFGKR